MKRTIAMLLLTALCVTVLTSCDTSGGLIALLWDEFAGVGEVSPLPPDNVDDIYGYETDIIIEEDSYDVLCTEPPVEPAPPIETETFIEIEYDTEPDTTQPSQPDGIDRPDDVLDLRDYLTLDGDISDWSGSFSDAYVFGSYNLDAWIGDVGGKQFVMYVASDPQYVYFAFDITDDSLCYSNDNTYSGDCFQIQIDFNGWAASSESFERAIFYSFGLQEDGTMDVTVQCIYDDAASTVDYCMASDDEPEWREGVVKGATRAKTDGSGWVAEFAISWETLYRDVWNKLMEEDIYLPDVDFEHDQVKLKMLICYIDRDAANNITGAWGTSQYRGALSSVEGWYPENAGVIVDIFPDVGISVIASLYG